MSFIYAEKNVEILHNGEQYETTQIFSDTKTELIGAVKANWSEAQAQNIAKYGFIKSMIIAPKCCISFVGNDVANAHKLLGKAYETKVFSEQQLIDWAFSIHKSAKEDDIDFLICYADDNDETHIVCIKEGQISYGCQSAWIGSRKTFEKMQELRIMDSTKSSSTLFDMAISSDVDDTVGIFSVHVIFGVEEKRFLYPYRFVSVIGRTQTVKPFQSLDLYGTASEGSLTVEYRESYEDVIIDFHQNDFTIAYTQKYRLSNKDLNNEHTKYFMLPIRIKTSTQSLKDVVDTND